MFRLHIQNSTLQAFSLQGCKFKKLKIASRFDPNCSGNLVDLPSMSGGRLFHPQLESAPCSVDNEMLLTKKVCWFTF
jgi:hypothetical protein